MREDDDLGKTEEKDEKNSWGPSSYQSGNLANSDHLSPPSLKASQIQIVHLPQRANQHWSPVQKQTDG
ncbi:hypothetical protein SADUNF_Sadunf02G0129400 [Salix dunnii]|uniref:Uncharacterized protein n=1 Tax=Salix dunnii TaxID=1413687 RepID=A0A835N7N4_9ROSI|nr:hypothetical protein SADUNF_Sadunf02G0129400 [Salix dunnii]